MSAFIITRRTMDVVVTALQDTQAQSSRRTFAGELIDTDSTALDRIGRKLWDLNAKAVQGRYPGHDQMAAEGFDLSKTYRWTGAYWPSATRQQVRCRYAKALDCLIYQCEEDATHNDPLLAELKDARDDLHREIVHGLTDYQGVPWDFPEESVPKVVRLI